MPWMDVPTGHAQEKYIYKYTIYNILYHQRDYHQRDESLW